MPADRSYEAGPSRPRPRYSQEGAQGKKKSYKTAKTKANNAPSTLNEKHKPQALQYRTPDGLPGVNKIKASIRQTTRLLKKPDLEPGLKVQTERRLESLQADLARAERRDTEKKIGAKYHMVKFFERKKLLRIIKRQQKHIKKATEAEDAKTMAKSEETLRQARIMLNYIVHFSKSEKYISLFPPDLATAEDTESDQKKISLPPHLSPSTEVDEADTTAKRRLEILRQVETMMSEGKLPAKPEEEKDESHEAAHITVPSAAEGSKASKGGIKAAKKEAKVDDDFFDSD